MQSEPVASRVLDSLINGSEFHHQSFISSFVLECYVAKGLVYDGLVLFSKIRSNRYKAETRGCIALLDALQLKGEVKMGWCFCGAIVRYGVFLDSGLVSVIARLLCKHGKVENAAGLLKSGVCSSRVIYGLVIDCYCKKGDFTAAVELLSDMYSKRLSPDFDIYSSMLDGACRFRNSRFVEMMVDDMFAKGFLPDTCFLDYNMIIEKLCKLRKTYAAEMFFERALVENSCLRHALYGSMLLALCKEAQVKEAMTMYKRIRLMGITFNVSCYFAFASILCNQEPSLEVERLLTDLIERGFLPSVSDLSKFLATQCNQGRWKQAEGLINIITEKGILPDFLCCCSLVEHYCSNKQIDLAVGLHDKMEKLGGTLDVVTYNGLLIGLFKGTMIEETIRVFDYMRKHNIGSSVSYSIMITGLCHAKEMRKAMKFHDEMLEMRLKPNEATYKRLVGRFCN
ncbi:hypothetical protein GIB67_021111 [Kingdonia uniflora]|uniref:Pentatricopeptide repeat-containing protein n=1 Tax=Kingdonia uniflora TaxID=39325 RepID=A0A7J7N7D0_9MAGN|nr:hypothetical protein GIB67_021111 [Kingdonia uniflora]